LFALQVTNKRDEKWKYCGSLPLAEGEESLLQIQAKHTASAKV
jgi:hypothetical protein